MTFLRAAGPEARLALAAATLAWMLGIAADALEVDSPDIPEVDVDDLATALGL